MQVTFDERETKHRIIVGSEFYESLGLEVGSVCLLPCHSVCFDSLTASICPERLLPLPLPLLLLPLPLLLLLLQLGILAQHTCGRVQTRGFWARCIRR